MAAPIPTLPKPVTQYVRKVFASCNRAVSLRIARVPNVSEPSLDFAFIDHLAGFASPAIVAQACTTCSIAEVGRSQPQSRSQSMAQRSMSCELRSN